MPQQSDRIETIHSSAGQVLQRYAGLSIAGKRVVAPYFMNEKGKRGKRVAVGKGRPEELERETVRLAKKHGFNLTKASAQEIREFMIRHELGIDCSGLVAWTLHALARQRFRRALWHGLDFRTSRARAIVARYVRQVENISVRVLTHDNNSLIVHSLADVQVGDVIRTLNGHHILLITEIGYSKANIPTYFRYVSSTEYDNVKYGVREGLIHITDLKKDVLHQEWIDGENGVNWIFNDAKRFPKDTRIVRIKVLADATIATM